MTEQKFIDYMWDYNDMKFYYGRDVIKKISSAHIWTTKSYNCTHSDGRKTNMNFLINDKKTTFKECVSIINAHIRNEKLNRILNG